MDKILKKEKKAIVKTMDKVISNDKKVDKKMEERKGASCAAKTMHKKK